MNAKTCSAFVLVAFLLLTGCKRDDMALQPKYVPYAPAEQFADGASARPLVPGVVPRTDAYAPGHPYFFVRDAGPAMNEASPREMPFPVTTLVMQRGRERYEIYCAECHGRLGNGLGMIVQRGLTPPPSYHIDRLRKESDWHFYDVITHGWGTMYSYNDRVLPADRWAIVAYIRALQRLGDDPRLTEADRRTLYGSGNGVHNEGGANR